MYPRIEDRRSIWIAVFFCAFYLVAYALLVLLDASNKRLNYGVNFAGTALLALAAAYLCSFKSGRTDARQQLAWRLVGVACATFAISCLVLGWYSAVEGVTDLVPIGAQVFEGLTLIVGYLAVVLMSSPEQLFSARLKSIFDSLIVGAGLLMVAWVASGADGVNASKFGYVKLTDDFLPAFAVVAFLAMTSSVAIRWRSRDRTTLIVILFALLAFAVNTIADVYFRIHGTDFAPPIAYLGYPASFIALGLAAVLPEPVIDQATSSSYERQAALPYAVAVVGVGGWVYGRFAHGSSTLFTTVIAIVLLTGIIMRQLLVLIENRNLTYALIDREQSLVNYAYRDNLTGLNNRLVLDERFNENEPDEALTPHRAPTAVMLLDLDRFKRVNDTLGHPSGDKLLQVVAERLLNCVRADDLVIRTGGDEFAVIIERAMRQDEIGLVARRIIDSLTEPVMLEGQKVSVGTSIGIVLPSSGSTASIDVVRDADIALYAAKRSGGNDYLFYDASLAGNFIERLELEAALSMAVDRGEFHLDYQPIIDLQTGMPVGAEALIRWDHPERGRLLPASFLAAAEDSGKIVAIGRWVLNEALTQAYAWRHVLPGGENFWISVNVSARQLLADDIAQSVRVALEASGLDSSAVKVELTESMLVDNSEMTQSLLESTHNLGVNLSLDDFGTGYSSLSYLRRLPIASLKIDPSFVAELNVSADGTLIVEAIVKLAHALELDVVAEGIETEAQYRSLCELGCKYGQGHYWSQSLRAAEFSSWWATMAGRRDALDDVDVGGES